MSEHTTDKKKVYTQPTITDHGKVVEQTQGITGTAWEVFGSQPADVGGKH